ncbi:MAG: hypothetical protein KKA07_05815 [Bacteroidetes bacterium]|nr:hypothetical protein [Bacteroidota bacterium]MBU1718571.1 hypothetical protein [Bacteroidota bacterium]
MIQADIGFGIYVFSLPGWGLMIFLILIECAMMSELIRKMFFNQSIFITTIISNFISAILGMVISLLVTSGKWLIVWFPWVGREEVATEKQFHLFAIYYILAVGFTILIEVIANSLLLRQKYRLIRIIRATFVANLISIICGSAILYIFSFL